MVRSGCRGNEPELRAGKLKPNYDETVGGTLFLITRSDDARDGAPPRRIRDQEKNPITAMCRRGMQDGPHIPTIFMIRV